MSTLLTKKVCVFELDCPVCGTVRIDKDTAQAYFSQKKNDQSVTPFYKTIMQPCKRCKNKEANQQGELVMQSLIEGAPA